MADRFDGQEHQIREEAGPPNPIRPVATFARVFSGLLLLQTVLSLCVIAGESAWVGPGAVMLAMPLSFLSGIGCLVASSRCRSGSVRDPLIPAIILFLFGALCCTFGAVLLSSMHRGLPVDLFYYTGGGGRGSSLVGIVFILVGLGVLAAGAGLWVNRGAYQGWRASRNAECKGGRVSD